MIDDDLRNVGKGDTEQQRGSVVRDRCIHCQFQVTGLHCRNINQNKILFTMTGLIVHDLKLLLLLAFHGLAAFKCGQVDCYNVIYHHDQKSKPTQYQLQRQGP